MRNLFAALTYDDIVKGLRDSTAELSREGLQVRAGYKQEQQTAAIIERYAWLYSNEALGAVDVDHSDPQQSEARRRVRSALMQGMIDRQVAAQDDRLTTFYATANIELAGEQLPFFTAQARLSREPDPQVRERLGEAGAVVMAQADDMALEVNARTLEVIKSFGYDSYVGFWSDLKQVDYGRLLSEVLRIAEQCHDLYRRSVEPWMRAAGHAFDSCPQWHLSYFRGLPKHDPVFTKQRFQASMEKTFRDLGLQLFSEPTIHIDLEDRPSKNPRASVWVPEAGIEVHLLTRPNGGHHDYAAFLHESGHALHFGLTDPAIGWPLANLGRSMAYTELWSFLVEHIGHQPGWIADATGVSREQAESVAGDLAAVDLMMFMRYVAKLAYELELHSGDALDAKRGQTLYAQTLSGQSGFRYDQRPWQYDRDASFYSADYLRAWLAQAALERQFREMFGERWWATRQAGDWLQKQWRRGSEPEAEETVAEAGGKPWSGEALIRLYSERLAGKLA